MSTKFFLGFGLIVLVFVAYGYSQTVATERGVGDAGPKITVEPKDFDFGEVEFGNVVEQIFEVKNTGEDILEIKKVFHFLWLYQGQGGQRKN